MNNALYTIGTILKEGFGWILLFSWCFFLLATLWAFAK